MLCQVSDWVYTVLSVELYLYTEAILCSNGAK